jgi:hypothetical protein
MSEEMRGADALDGLRDVFEEHPEDAGGASDPEAGGEGALMERLSAARTVLDSRRVQWALLFAAGLLVGWLVLGWLIWPVQWTNAMPWHLQTFYQERYVTMVAETFWLTGDLREAQTALEGWEPEELKEVLKKLQQESENDEQRQQVAALASALEFPTYDTSIWASLRNQKAILGGASVSILLFGAAGALAVYSLVQTRSEGGVRLGVAGEGLADDEIGMEDGAGGYDDMEDYPDEVEEGDGLVIGAGEEEESEDEEEDDLYDAEEDFYEEGEDVVSSLSAFMFDEEEEDVSHLKDLCERLPEIDVSELLEEAREVAGELKRGIELRSRESRF